jgi:hypothetical protein
MDQVEGDHLPLMSFLSILIIFEDAHFWKALTFMDR